MGLLDLLFGRKPAPAKKSRIFLTSQGSTSFEPSDQAPQSQSRIRKDLLRLVLRDVLARTGIPGEWLTAEMVSSASPRRGDGIHVRFLVRHWSPRLLEHGPAFQEEFTFRLLMLDPRAQELARAVLADRELVTQAFTDFERVTDAGVRIRCHGDYHLGQILVSEGDIVILDFEGEPARPLAERRAKYSPLRDVAGMLRSFSYAALTALNAATLTRPEDIDRLRPWAQFWETWVRATYLRAYLSTTRDAGLLPSTSESRDVVLQAFVVNKALYELGYELNNRPDWVHVPLAALESLRTSLHA